MKVYLIVVTPVDLSWISFTYYKCLLMANACLFTLSWDNVIIYCFKLEYIGGYYLKHPLDINIVILRVSRRNGMYESI